MYFAKEHDIFELSKGQYLLINYISGAADIIDDACKSALESGNYSSLDKNTFENLISRKYFFSSNQEYDQYLRKLDTKLLNMEKFQIPNFLLIPSYNCNFNCSYCYQKSYEIEKFYGNKDYSKKVVDDMFVAMDEIVESIGNQANENSIKVTLMGGEPLFSHNNDILPFIFERLEDKKYKVSIITNGYELDNYIPFIKKVNIDFIQITMDGTKEIHDTKRFNIKHEGTFDVIVKNMRKALEAGINVEVRNNIDADNILNLPAFADVLLDLKKDYPNLLHPYIYILQDGGCSGNKTVIDEIESLKTVLALEKIHPNLRIFRKTFHGIDLINSIINNIPFRPKMSNCASCRNQYILDGHGRIYKCWFGVGNDEFNIGEFNSDLKINYVADNAWKRRNVKNLVNCLQCKYRYICGGGCANHTAIDPNTGIRREKCADFKTIMEIYFNHFFAENKNEEIICK